MKTGVAKKPGGERYYHNTLQEEITAWEWDGGDQRLARTLAHSLLSSCVFRRRLSGINQTQGKYQDREDMWWIDSLDRTWLCRRGCWVTGSDFFRTVSVRMGLLTPVIMDSVRWSLVSAWGFSVAGGWGRMWRVGLVLCYQNFRISAHRSLSHSSHHSPSRSLNAHRLCFRPISFDLDLSFSPSLRPHYVTAPDRHIIWPIDVFERYFSHSDPTSYVTSRRRCSEESGPYQKLW